MNFRVDDECLRLGLRAGAIVFRGVSVGPSRPELVEEITREAAAIRQRFAGPDQVRAAPEVVAFQELLRKVGVNPRREQSSVEKLLTFALKRGALPAINSLVDTYNLVSIRTGCSLGAHDIDRIVLPVLLQVVKTPMPFTPLGGGHEAVVRPGEYAYLDARDRVLCRLDVIQADFSKVTGETTSALLILEATASHPPHALRDAFTQAAAEVVRHCGGTAEVIAFPRDGASL